MTTRATATTTNAVAEHTKSIDMGISPEETPQMQMHVLDDVAFHSTAYSNFQELTKSLHSEMSSMNIDNKSDEHVDQIKKLLSQVRINENEWRQYTSFKENKYTRNIVGHDEKFTMLLLCWNKNQCSPIHDHSDSNCWVKVLHGELTETRYKHKDDGSLYSCNRAVAPKDAVCYINDSMGYHTMANENSDDVTVSLHVYSPPFKNCYIFDMDGAKREVSLQAANAPYESFFDPEETKTSLNDLSEKLEKIGPVGADEKAWSQQVYDTLAGAQVSEKEWETYTHFSDFRYQRSMVFCNTNFSVLINCWMAGQETPVHMHGTGTNSWFRVLSGEVDYREHGENQQSVASTTTFRADSPPFFEGSGQQLHSIKCNNGIAITLHIYSPPYKELTYCVSGATKTQTIPMVHHGATESEHCCTGQATELVFTNFSAMSNMLQREFDLSRKADERLVNVMSLLERASFHADEIETMRKLSERAGSNLVLHRSKDFVVELKFWSRGQTTAVHDHTSSNSWTKVLEGNLSDITYELNDATKELEVTHTAMLMTNALSYLRKGVKHSLRNGDLAEAVSINVTSPPMDECTSFTAAGNAKQHLIEFVQADK